MKTRSMGNYLFHAGAETYRETGKRTYRKILRIKCQLSKFCNDPINDRNSAFRLKY